MQKFMSTVDLHSIYAREFSQENCERDLKARGCTATNVHSWCHIQKSSHVSTSHSHHVPFPTRSSSQNFRKPGLHCHYVSLDLSWWRRSVGELVGSWEHCLGMKRAGWDPDCCLDPQLWTSVPSQGRACMKALSLLMALSPWPWGFVPVLRLLALKLHLCHYPTEEFRRIWIFFPLTLIPLSSICIALLNLGTPAIPLRIFRLEQLFLPPELLKPRLSRSLHLVKNERCCSLRCRNRIIIYASSPSC